MFPRERKGGHVAWFQVKDCLRLLRLFAIFSNKMNGTLTYCTLGQIVCTCFCVNCIILHYKRLPTSIKHVQSLGKVGQCGYPKSSHAMVWVCDGWLAGILTAWEGVWGGRIKPDVGGDNLAAGDDVNPSRCLSRPPRSGWERREEGFD